VPSAQRAIAWLLAAVFFAVGPLLILLALLSVARTEISLHNSIRTDGRVIGIERVRVPYRQRWTYAPVLRFTKEDGQLYMVVSADTSSPPAFKVGESIRVYYPPGRPEHARIDEFLPLYRFPLVGIVLGGALTALSLAAARSRRRRIAFTV
jgi:hypothetical protein